MNSVAKVTSIGRGLLSMTQVCLDRIYNVRTFFQAGGFGPRTPTPSSLLSLLLLAAFLLLVDILCDWICPPTLSAVP